MASRLPRPTRLASAHLTAPLQRTAFSPAQSQAVCVPPPLLLPLLPRHHGHYPRTSRYPTTIPSNRRPSSTWLLSALSNLHSAATGNNNNNTNNNNNKPPPKTLRARRTLPYPPWQVYALIADIDAYARFLPHCTHSRVTHWTRPSTTSFATGQGGQQEQQPRRYPAQADLTIGWGPFTQTYTSRVYCVPGSVVEAVSGAGQTTIPRETLRRVGYEDDDEIVGADGRKTTAMMMKKVGEGGIFESLTTRWTVRPVAAAAGRGNGLGGGGGAGEEEWTEVALSVTFQFANPALGFAVSQLADDKVDEMVAAFEGRARELYGRR